MIALHRFDDSFCWIAGIHGDGLFAHEQESLIILDFANQHLRF